MDKITDVVSLSSGGFNAEGQLGHLRRGPRCLKHTPPPQKKTFAWLEAIPLRLKQRSTAETLLSNLNC